MPPRCKLPRRSERLEHNQCHGPFNFFPALLSVRILILPLLFLRHPCATELLQLLTAMFSEPRPDVQLHPDGDGIKDVVRTAAVAGVQIYKAREIVVESEVYPVVPC